MSAVPEPIVPIPAAALLLPKLRGQYEGIEARLRVVPYEWHAEGLRVSGTFVYLAFRDGTTTQAEFVEFILSYMVGYCIPRRIRDEAIARYQATGDDRVLVELVTQARRLFVAARNSRITAGEPGELMLFVILEGLLKAPQLIAKMALKSNPRAPILGSDGIHVGAGEGPGTLRVYWGESKLYADLNDGIAAASASMMGFITARDGHVQRDHELTLIRDNAPDNLDESLRDDLLEFFNPISESYNRREEAFACLVGFDFDHLGAPLASDAAGLVAFETSYRQKIETACARLAEKMKACALKDYRMHFCMIPFKSVAEVRSTFFSQLGIEDAPRP